jgi:hypothetical protein
VAEPLPARPSCPDCGARASARSKACAACGNPFVEDAPRARRPGRRWAARAGAGGAERPRLATLAVTVGAQRRRSATLVLATGGLAAAAAAALMVTLGGADAGDAGQDPPDAAEPRRSRPELLARHPLSARAAERRLEARFVSPRDDDSASARCSALEPRPAHAIRWCRIRYARGGERTVIVLSNPQGFELLVRR